MHKPVKNNVSWVGKVDWELRDFHGHELSTHRGTSYNSYLIKEEKVALVDTVWLPYAEEFVDNLAQEIPWTGSTISLSTMVRLTIAGLCPS